MNERDVLHTLRNPRGRSQEELRCVHLRAADLIEQYRDAYENMREFARASGLDTATRNVPTVEEPK